MITMQVTSSQAASILMARDQRHILMGFILPRIQNEFIREALEKGDTMQATLNNNVISELVL